MNHKSILSINRLLFLTSDILSIDSRKYNPVCKQGNCFYRYTFDNYKSLTYLIDKNLVDKSKSCLQSTP